MRLFTTALALLVMIILLPGSGQAQTDSKPPTESWVWLTKQNCWGLGYQLKTGPYAGMWRISRKEQAAPPSAGDQYGFGAMLNSFRARHGLGSLAHDATLTTWAAANNAAQQLRGLGHFVFGTARRQNSGWNYQSTASVFSGWCGSPGHLAALLDPTIRRYGIAFNGVYWTFNAN